MPEQGQDAVRALRQITISALAQVEVAAAFWRKRRTGELSVNGAYVLAAEFAGDVRGTDRVRPRFTLVGVDDAVLAAAARLVARHPLRAYDAVQLATALAVTGRVPGTRFVSFDTQLNAAAATEGLQLL